MNQMKDPMKILLFPQIQESKISSIHPNIKTTYQTVKKTKTPSKVNKVAETLPHQISITFSTKGKYQGTNQNSNKMIVAENKCKKQ